MTWLRRDDHTGDESGHVEYQLAPPAQSLEQIASDIASGVAAHYNGLTSRGVPDALAFVLSQQFHISLLAPQRGRQ